jgi:hypothetical protein
MSPENRLLPVRRDEVVVLVVVAHAVLLGKRLQRWTLRGRSARPLQRRVASRALAVEQLGILLE